jgi:hypothetical protein
MRLILERTIHPHLVRHLDPSHGDYDKQNQVVNEELIKFKDQTGHLTSSKGWPKGF